MTASTGMTGIGSVFKIGDGATPTEGFDACANVNRINLDFQSDETDKTHLGSASGFRETGLSFTKGTATLELQFDPDHATHDDGTGLWALLASKALNNFKLDWTAADNGGAGAPSTKGVMTLAGRVSGFSIDTPEGNVIGNVTIALSGLPTFDAT